MAKLHLQIDLNEVTDAEFRALCDALEGKAGKPGGDAPRGSGLRATRRDGDLRAMRRAWQCPQDAPARAWRPPARRAVNQ